MIATTTTTTTTTTNCSPIKSYLLSLLSLITSVIIWSLAINTIITIGANCQPRRNVDNFKPFIEDLSIKVAFKTSTFAREGDAKSFSELVEQYDSRLETGSAKQVVYEWGSGERLQVTKKRKLIYNAESRKVVEIVYRNQIEDDEKEEAKSKSSNNSSIIEEDDDQQNDDYDIDEDLEESCRLDSFDEFQLFENGGSSSYGDEFILGDLAASYKNNNNNNNNNHLQQPQQQHSAILNMLTHSTSAQLDTQLIFAGQSYDYMPSLDLEPFFHEDCLKKLNNKLNYVFGLTRLLLLIECRRDEFHLMDSSPLTKVRGISSRLYTADSLTTVSTRADSLGDITRLDSVMITIDEQESFEYGDSLIPLSISFKLNAFNVSVLINVVQFDQLDWDEHLSEADKSQSWYLLPLGRDIGRLLLTDRVEDPASSDNNNNADDLTLADKTQYSFHGRLSFEQASNWFGNRDKVGDNSILPLPLVDVYVFFDGNSNLLSLKWQTMSATGLPSASQVSMIYDFSSNRKYHIDNSLMKDADDDDGDDDNDENDDDINDKSKQSIFEWRTCVSDQLTSAEREQLTAAAAADLTLFELHDAAFMGLALVRGIPVRVYEKQVFKLPFWLLGLSNQDLIHVSREMASGRMYATLYVAATSRETLGGSDDGGNQLLLAYRLELHSFAWSVEQHFGDDDDDDVSSLDHQLNAVAAQCLAEQSSAAAANTVELGVDYELQLALGSVSDAAAAAAAAASKPSPARPESTDVQAAAAVDFLQELANDKWRLEQLVAQALSKSTLGISQLQQTQLETKLIECSSSSPSALASIDQQKAKAAAAAAAAAVFKLSLSMHIYDLPREIISERSIGFCSIDQHQQQQRQRQQPVGIELLSLDECKWLAMHSMHAKREQQQALSGQNAPESVRVYVYCAQLRKCILGGNEEDKLWSQIKQFQAVRIDSIGLQYPANSSVPQHQQCLIKTLTLRQPNEQQQPPTSWTATRHDSSPVERLLQLASRHGHLLTKRLDSFDLMLDNKYKFHAKQARIGEFISPSETTTTTTGQLDGAAANQRQSLISSTGLQGLAYVLPPVNFAQLDAAESSTATTTAVMMRTKRANECRQVCLLNHQCNSYSSCRLDDMGDIECLFSSIDWLSIRAAGDNDNKNKNKNKNKNNNLNGIFNLEAAAAAATEQQAARRLISLEANDGKVLTLRRSPLCSLHALSHASIAFTFAGLHLQPRLAQKYLMYAQSVWQCAQFCMERGQLIASSGVKNAQQLSELSERRLGCTSFEFNLKYNYCVLKNARDIDNLIADNNGKLENTCKNQGVNTTGDSDEEICRIWKKWKLWRQPKDNDDDNGQTPKNWRKSLLETFQVDEVEVFSLDYRKLFETHEWIRIISYLPDKQNVNQLQQQQQVVLLAGIETLEECARKCISIESCKSFGHAPKLNECQLNALALSDIVVNLDEQEQNKLESGYKFKLITNSSEWFHYEPSELGNFILPSSSSNISNKHLKQDKIKSSTARPLIDFERSQPAES